VDAIDLCCATQPEREIDDMKWLIALAESVTDKPLSIDSSNPKTILAAFPTARNPKANWVNSITGDPKRYEPLLPLVKEHGCGVVALCMDEKGVPDSPQGRLDVARRLLDRISAYGISLDNVFLDGLIDPISLGVGNGVLTLATIALLKRELPGVKIIICLTGISFGLPGRNAINCAFLPLVVDRGVDAIILDPLNEQVMATLRAAEAILGHDEFCQRYIAAHRGRR
jgi:5-methyltetrahydrofolate--homocysteine methyltransferase